MIYKFTEVRSSSNPKQDKKYKEHYNRDTIIKLLKTKNGDKNLESFQKKWYLAYRTTIILITTDFSPETIRTVEHFLSAKRKVGKSRILYKTKTALKMKANKNMLRRRKTKRIGCQKTCSKRNVKRSFLDRSKMIHERNLELQKWGRATETINIRVIKWCYFPLLKFFKVCITVKTKIITMSGRVFSVCRCNI